MKTVLKISMLFWVVLLSANITRAQTTVCANEEVCLTTTHRGSIQWQESTDMITWSPVSGATGDTLCFIATTDMYYRAMILEGTCDTLYSDTAEVVISPLLMADAGQDTTFQCDMDSVMLGGSPTASGGVSPYNYVWNPSAGLSSMISANPKALVNAPATFYVTVTDGNGCVATDSVFIDTSSTPTGIDTFSFSGGIQFWIVPPCVDSVTINLWGAKGGDRPSYTGGAGGYASGKLGVSAGDTLWLYVGGQGLPSQSCNAQGGWNGGGNTGDTCCSNSGGLAGTGGGASDVRMNGQSLSDRVIVAAGGGGAGANGAGGAGGGLTGTNGGTYNSVTATGGTQTSGGQAGGHYLSHTCSWGTDGSFGQGGTGDGNDGGGGGGGWYGGGGGPNNYGAGGGSSYIGGVVNGSTTGGANSTGDGSIIIIY